MTGSAKVPEHMAVHVFSRLPPKPLMRFKCINKSFRSLIENPNFATKHLSDFMNSMHSSLYVIFKRLVREIGDMSNVDKSALCSLLNFCHDQDCDEHNNYSNFENVLSDSLSTHLKAMGQDLELEILESGTILCQCHGMICQAHIASYQKLLLCNLVTKDFKLAPETCIPLNPLDYTNKCSVGFGYNPQSNNYKLVRIICYGEEELADQRIIIFPPRIEVHTLGTDSWREISIGNLETKSTFLWPMHHPFYFKARCFWKGQEQGKEFEDCYSKSDWEYIRGLVVYFDMAQETFNHVLFPEELYGPVSFYDFARISEWNESLALFGLYRINQVPEDAEVGIWVMDDTDGIKDSWTLKVSIRPTDIIVQEILYLWKDDEMIIVDPDDRLISYNFETKEIKPFPLMSVWPQYYEVLVCMNSLIFR